MERPGATTLRGNPLTVLGPALKPGDKAPDFKAVDDSLKDVNLAGTGGGVRIFSVVPSLDTPVCDAQTKRFNEEAGKLPNVKIYTISMDLPFAQKRWCGAFGVDHVKMVSDHRDGSGRLARCDNNAGRFRRRSVPAARRPPSGSFDGLIGAPPDDSGPPWFARRALI